MLKEISQNYQSVSLESLAKKTNYNHSYLGTLFKNETGSPFSKIGDRSFNYQLIDLTTNTVKKLIIYYFHLYHQEYILKKDTLKLAIVAKRYALSFLGPLFMWVEYSDEFTLKETKKMMKLMVLNSPYDISTHGF